MPRLPHACTNPGVVDAGGTVENVVADKVVGTKLAVEEIGSDAVSSGEGSVDTDTTMVATLARALD